MTVLPGCVPLQCGGCSAPTPTQAPPRPGLLPSLLEHACPRPGGATPVFLCSPLRPPRSQSTAPARRRAAVQGGSGGGGKAPRTLQRVRTGPGPSPGSPLLAKAWHGRPEGRSPTLLAARKAGGGTSIRPLGWRHEPHPAPFPYSPWFPPSLSYAHTCARMRNSGTPAPIPLLPPPPALCGCRYNAPPKRVIVTGYTAQDVPVGGQGVRVAWVPALAAGARGRQGARGQRAPAAPKGVGMRGQAPPGLVRQRCCDCG